MAHLQRRERAEEATSGLDVDSTNSCNNHHYHRLQYHHHHNHHLIFTLWCTIRINRPFFIFFFVLNVLIITACTHRFSPTLVLLLSSPPQKSSLGPPWPSSWAKGAPSENVSVFSRRPASSVTKPGVRLAWKVSPSLHLSLYNSVSMIWSSLKNEIRWNFE